MIHDLIDIELLRSGIKYSITINPPFSSRLDKIAIRKWYLEQMANLSQMTSCCLILFPELSKVLRPHLHGIIIIKDVSDFICNDYHYLLNYGNICIDNVSNLLKWMEYCIKGVCYMQPIIKGLPYPFSCNYDFNYIDKKYDDNIPFVTSLGDPIKHLLPSPTILKKDYTLTMLGKNIPDEGDSDEE